MPSAVVLIVVAPKKMSLFFKTTTAASRNELSPIFKLTLAAANHFQLGQII
jgi:hypothetical protein